MLQHDEQAALFSLGQVASTSRPDGDNVHSANANMNGAPFYTAYGYPYNRRLGKPGDSTATLQALMNQRLITTCSNAKTMGITVYTIGLSMTSSTTRNMLARCSSGQGYAYLPAKPSERSGVFEDIAGRLSILRLSM